MRRLLRWAGVDRAVGMTLIANGWSALAGLVGLPLMIRFLSPTQQGFYYAFSGFLSAIILFELGLSYVILQFASHERTALQWSSAGLLEGDDNAKGRLGELLRLSLRWYGVVSALILVTLLPAGLLFFGRNTPPGSHVAWQGPWIWIATASAGTVVLSPLLSILEGCGLVAQVAALKARQNILSSLLLWLALILHAGLWAAPIPATVMVVTGGSWLWRRQGGALRDLLAHASQSSLLWRTEVWPFQWRIALSGVSSYAIFQMFSLFLFATHGPVAAGQMGLSLSILSTVTGLSLNWVTTKAPAFGVLIAGRDWTRLDGLFFPAFWRSFSVAVLGAAGLWLGGYWLHTVGYSVGHRILDPLPFGLLAATAVINHPVGAEALYLRAHKKEPFLGLSLTIAALIAAANLLLSGPYGATGMMWAYFLINLIVGLGGGTWLFVHKRREWHHVVPAD